MPGKSSGAVTRILKEWARGLVRKTQVAHFENEVIGGLYRPPVATDDSSPFVFADDQRSEGMAEDGFAIPPKSLRMGYAQDDAEYIRSGQSSCNILRRTLSDHGVELGPGSAMLDWGSTTGRVLRGFAPEAAAGEAWGCDVDGPSIEWARSNLSPPFRFVTGTSFPHLPFEDGKFRFIYGLSVFTHIEHLVDAWLLELHRVLEPGGCAIFTIHDEHTVEYLRQHERPNWMPSGLGWDEILQHDVTVVRGERWSRTYTFFSGQHIRRHWGQVFDVAELRPHSEGYQTAVVLRKPAR
ncbi:MAG: class I SAM-dependent methyltransferase [Xanthomonadales bacterium]|nr:class I SAM-dependent methyltransferase [Gammaproteobacteria bacterium]NNE04454.1 class I SAM-dependent methyltransferase [Xanthomonadales bacterium]NNL96352.1 class I SAM-dependent methyltransferase [Xanthomonadales bacterium]